MRKKLTILDIKDKKILAIKGHYKKDKRIKHHIVYPEYIFFTDKKTYIELNTQDYYDYHDCNSEARTIEVWEDKEMWQIWFENTMEANVDINY